MSERNKTVEDAVRLALERVDAYINGENVVLPSKEHRRAADALLDGQAASVRTATLYLMCYWVCDPGWDLNSVPVGTRGAYGDKLLCEELGVATHHPVRADHGLR